MTPTGGWAIAQNVVVILTPLVLGWIALRTKKVVDATHQLSNSAMGAQLQDAVDSALEKSVLQHRLAELTNADGDKAAAAAADLRVIAKKKLLYDHLANQAIVDANDAKSF